MSFFSDQTELLKESAFRVVESRENNDLLGFVFNNRRIVYTREVVAGYLSHFNLNWLFITGDVARHHAPFMGLLYLWELPFLLIGMYMLIFGNFSTRIKTLIFSWFLIAPIPASITSGVPHAVRTLNFLPTFQIFIAIGIVSVLAYVSAITFKVLRIKVSYIFVICYLLFAAFNLFYYFNQYLVQQNYFSSQDWQYGYKEAAEEVHSIENKYEKIIVSNKPHMDQSYMFFLFYLQYPPDMYQKEAREASGGFRETHRFGKFEFRAIDWGKERREATTLFVGRIADFPSVHPGHVKTFNFLDGEPAIKLVEGE